MERFEAMEVRRQVSKLVLGPVVNLRGKVW